MFSTDFYRRFDFSHMYIGKFFFVVIRRPPISTRTDTLFPYTTLFRSVCPVLVQLPGRQIGEDLDPLLVGRNRPDVEAAVADRFDDLRFEHQVAEVVDRKSTRLNSSH